jgi:predicted anti-sigma-YlaC factor YlaD
MDKDQFICSACGARLNPHLPACPQCGEARKSAPADGPQSPQAAAAAPARESSPMKHEPQEVSAQQASSEPKIPIQRQPISDGNVPPHQMPSAIFMAPEAERRRFPIMTRQRLVLIAVGIALIIFLLIISYLIWRQHKRDQMQMAAQQAALLQTAPAPAAILEPTPTPTPPDDPTIAEAVKAALAAFHPQAATRYKFEVKDGIVTLNGEAEHQPEKDGAENVIRQLAGVQMVVNNLTVRPDPSLLPVKLNEAEAKRLEEALRKQLQGEQQSDEEVRQKQAQLEAQREADRLRREQAAAKQREEEAALRKAAEERLQRQAAEFERQQEEQRRQEAERRARAEQARLEASVLRSGTVAWSGVVSGVDEIVFSGSSVSVRHISGEPIQEARASFSAPIPRAPVNIKLLSANGRGTIIIVQEPSAANGYTTIVRVDDSGKGGNKRYEFTLRWSVE